MPLTIENLTSRINQAREQLDLIANKGYKTDADYATARRIEEDLIPLERELASRSGREAAMPIPGWPVSWSKHHRIREFSFSNNTLRFIHEVNENMDERLVSIRCNQCIAASTIQFSESAFFRHPLYRNGLSRIGAYSVINSQWIAKLANVYGLGGESMFGGHDWKMNRHFLFVFEDALVEFVGQSAEIENPLTASKGPIV